MRSTLDHRPLRRGVGPATLLAAALVALALASMALAAAPIVVVDDLGREVRLEARPERVVALVPSHTETVCALGACDRLVGRDTFSNYPEQVLALPDLGSAFTPDLEALVALRPDLVLVDEFSGAAEAIAALGIPVYAGTPQRLEEIFELIDTLALLLGARTEAALLNGRLRGELDAVAALVAERARPRVFYELDPSPYTVGPDGFIGTLLTLAGGENVVTSAMGDFPLVDPEFVVATDPQVIVLADAPYGVSAASVAERPGWAGIAAVRDGRVVELTQAQSDVLSRAGPRVTEALALLVRILHPGVF